MTEDDEITARATRLASASTIPSVLPNPADLYGIFSSRNAEQLTLRRARMDGAGLLLALIMSAVVVATTVIAIRTNLTNDDKSIFAILDIVLILGSIGCTWYEFKYAKQGYVTFSRRTQTVSWITTLKEYNDSRQALVIRSWTRIEAWQHIRTGLRRSDVYVLKVRWLDTPKSDLPFEGETIVETVLFAKRPAAVWAAARLFMARGAAVGTLWHVEKVPRSPWWSSAIHWVSIFLPTSSGRDYRVLLMRSMTSGSLAVLSLALVLIITALACLPIFWDSISTKVTTLGLTDALGWFLLSIAKWAAGLAGFFLIITFVFYLCRAIVRYVGERQHHAMISGYKTTPTTHSIL